MSDKILLEVKDLKQYFPIKGGVLGRTVNYVKAVDGISFSVKEGEVLSIVGESGCGKSTTGRAILRLNQPQGGEVIFDGVNLLRLRKSEMRKRRKDLQIIFQDPYASLNPKQTAYQILAEAMEIQKIAPGKQRRQKIVELFKTVGIGEYQIDRYPHEFSGGQRQRIGIARALSVNPKLIVCDEAVSALDVSIQAQVINLLKELQKDFGLTYLFIAHDLGVVRHISDRIMVMYLGKIVEIADKKSLFAAPQHPYTYALLSAIPSTKIGEKKERILLKGDVPSPINPPLGCRFYSRCPFAFDRCKDEAPALHKVTEGHESACHLLEQGPVDFTSMVRSQKP